MHEPWQDMLPLYVNGRLPEDERRALDRHLAHCAECRAALMEWRILTQAAAAEAAVETLRTTLPPLVLRGSSRYSLNSPKHRKPNKWGDMNMFISAARSIVVRPAQPRSAWLLDGLTFAMAILVASMLVMLTILQSPIIGNLQRPEDKNMEVFRRYIDEAWNAGNLSVLDEVLTEGYLRHDPLVSDGMPGAETERELITLFRTAAPDLHVAIDNITADGDRVMARMAISGTLTAPLQLSSDLLIPGNGQPFTLSTIHSVRFEDEKMAEMWVATDPQSLMQQLGAVVHLQTVAHNDDWTPITAEFDGVEMVLVPPGRFMMGATAELLSEMLTQCLGFGVSENECHGWFDQEAPVHQVAIDYPFWIDAYEVTNQQFEQFSGEAASEGHWTDADLPRETIDWEEAQNFCEVRGGRLPAEAEWEYSARGPDSLLYPWGDEFDGALVNSCDANCTESYHDTSYDDGIMYTAPVGTYSPAGDSWVGASDLVGNVWEWTSTIYDQARFPYPYNPNDGREDMVDITSPRVMRGSGYLSVFSMRSSVRGSATTFGYTEGSLWGFRCVRDYEGMPMSSTASDTTQTPPEDNAGRFEAYVDQVWNGGDLAPLDGLFTDGYVRHDPMVVEGVTDPDATVISMFRTGLPDLQVTIDELVRDGDRVWAQLTLTGTHTGLFAYNDTTLIPSSGNSITLAASNLVRFEEGQIAEMWVEMDTLDLLGQLDVSVVLQPVAHNDDWTPVIQEFDGVEMVLVPAGRFMMGSTVEEIEQAYQECVDFGSWSEADCRLWVDIEGPISTVIIEAPFWIDRYEVSNEQFDGSSSSTRRSNITDPDHPREYITWEESRDFCELRGGRLPTEAEWEFAARGVDNLVYPWGNEFDPNTLNYCDQNCLESPKDEEHDDGYRYTAPVGAYSPAGDSWVGAADMAGNVWEWTGTIFDQRKFPYPYDPDDGRDDMTGRRGVGRSIRGGAFINIDLWTRSAVRDYLSAQTYYALGFRCVRDYDG